MGTLPSAPLLNTPLFVYNMIPNVLMTLRLVIENDILLGRHLKQRHDPLIPFGNLLVHFDTKQQSKQTMDTPSTDFCIRQYNIEN